VRMQAEFVIARIKGDCLYGHHVACDDRHYREPSVLHAFGIAGAQDGARRLIDMSGRVIDERLTDSGNEEFVGEDVADFLLGDLHGSRSSESGAWMIERVH